MEIQYQEIENIEKKLLSYPEAKLLIVTKNRPQALVIELIQKGHQCFGENRVQEAHSKYFEILNENISLHLIGPLQTNKTKIALELFDTIQTIDRPKLVNEISKYKKDNIRTKDFYIQVNIGQEPQKAGVPAKFAKDLYKLCVDKNLSISGLMCIPPANHNPSQFFKEMINLRNNINSKLKLSMGMSDDFEIALEHQSNMIRVGSLLFK